MITDLGTSMSQYRSIIHIAGDMKVYMNRNGNTNRYVNDLVVKSHHYSPSISVAVNKVYFERQFKTAIAPSVLHRSVAHCVHGNDQE